MIRKSLLSLLVIAAQLIACTGNNQENTPPDDFDVRFVLPAVAQITRGGEYAFVVTDGKAPKNTDLFVIESDGGISFECAIVNTSPESFTIRLNDECQSGNYRVFIKRGERKKTFGKIYIDIVDEIDDFTPDEGTTVYGRVTTDGSYVQNVVVSDGHEVVVTDIDGIYQLKSAKEWGYVFISVPSEFEVPSEGVRPLLYHKLKGGPDVVERADFTLTWAGNQNSYKLFVLGDMHLANRTDDIRQFYDFTNDLNEYMSQHNDQKMYAIALGDMTWDLYWYSKNFGFEQYLNTINGKVRGLQIFHTMGNHDNDYKATSDYSAAAGYVYSIAPTYYSFNIGNVHYVVLDDIDCSGYDGTTSRNYVKNVTAEQLDWLVKDLSYVDKSRPVVIATHAQIFYPSSVSAFRIDHDQANTLRLFEILDGYTVHFLTGHTHLLFNVTPEAAITGGRNIHEHNSGAICASWWWSGHLTPGVHISPDGTPGGYAIWDVSGSDLKWIYKSTGWPEDYQFRSYDLNNVSFSTDDVPLMPSTASIRNAYQKYVDAYPQNSNNEVLINIWNWDRDWSLTVTDGNGGVLPHTQVMAYDPLHIAALSVKRFNSASITSTPNFVTTSFPHFFKVTAPDAQTDLTITVKDGFGNTWVENMQRPKAFSTDGYKRP